MRFGELPRVTEYRVCSGTADTMVRSPNPEGEKAGLRLGGQGLPTLLRMFHLIGSCYAPGHLIASIPIEIHDLRVGDAPSS